MAKKIFNIQNNLITFVGRDGREVAGDSEDCKFVGGHFDGTNCVIKAKSHNPNQTNERNILGQGNTIDNSAQNNNVLGNFNTVENVDGTHTIGRFAHTTRHGEFNHAYTTAKGRTQRSVLMFEGTTTDANFTEIYLGGVNGQRFIIDENHDHIIGFQATVLGYRVDSGGVGDCLNRFQHVTFEYEVSSGSLDQVGSTSTKTDHKNHSNSWDNRFVATTGTPDFIKVECKGNNTSTIHWSVILNVYELKTSAI